MNLPSKIKLGCRAKDVTSGAKGIIVTEVRHLHGGVEYGIQPVYDDLERPSIVWVPEPYIQYIDDGVHGDIKPKTPLGFTVDKKVLDN